MDDKLSYYIIITYKDNFLYFIDKNSAASGHIGFTLNIEEARKSETKWGKWHYKQFIKKIENTLRDFDEIITHPNVIIMKGKTYEDIHYFKDRVTLFNIGVYFKNYDTKKLRVVYNVTNIDIRKWKIKEIIEE